MFKQLDAITAYDTLKLS